RFGSIAPDDDTVRILAVRSAALVRPLHESCLLSWPTDAVVHLVRAISAGCVTPRPTQRTSPLIVDTWRLGREVPEKLVPGGKQEQPQYTEEFKRDAVALVRSSGKTVTEVAQEIGVSAEGLRNWVKQDTIDRGHGCRES
ncbi:transposase, partial [Streptomyces sp. NPDC056159]|uniref:transposase n=1 Tax=Streptomyces sp. NPDC056159 TaxID=3155537 RepID=UPI00344273DA